jgi:flagellar basal body-associated protein FliL
LVGRPGGLVRCTLLCIATIGCGSSPAFEFDKLDLVAAEEELEEFSLGEYAIPIPATKSAGGSAGKHNRIQMDFELFALVSAHEKSKLSHAWERHEGIIRDRVIRVCRSASLEVLHEPELGTLKAKLLDALAAQLGDDINQLLITDVVTQEI